MKCRMCGKELGVDSSIGIKGQIMCFPCGVKELKESGVDVAWLGLDRLRHQRRRSHPEQRLLILNESS